MAKTNDHHPPRILLCKSSMDMHDRGARYIAIRLRDSGMEVIFINFLDPNEIVSVASQEDVDLIGFSSSVQGHLPILQKLHAELINQGMGDIPLMVGGIIPQRDYPALQEMGIEGIFGPGTNASDVVSFVRQRVTAIRASKMDEGHSKASVGGDV
jgi:methylmalonyl-CoA mutase cobalamin-binding domain/chain